LANESGETAHEVALSLADRTIRLLLLAIEMRQPLDQATRQMLDDLRAARDLPDFDFDDNPADRSRLAELARFVGNAPHGDFEKLKTLLKREAHEVVKWRARAERRQNTLDDNDSFSPCELRQLIGVSANRLNIYAKAAGVKTPGRGKKNFRYTREDAITVLKHVRKTATEDTVREQCIAALRDRFEITS
jgi:hypothetical protein